MKNALIIVGPSCVGKTTVANGLCARLKTLELTRSATTRAPRGDANDGEYIYLTREEFSSRVDKGEMLEYMEYSGNLYGTPKSELERIFSLGKTPLLILDINGVKSVRSGVTDFSAVIIYLYSDIVTLERRLHDRYLANGADDEKIMTFSKRKEANIRDYRSLVKIHTLFDAFIKNLELEKTIDEIIEVFSRSVIGELSVNHEKNEEIARELAGAAG